MFEVARGPRVARMSISGLNVSLIILQITSLSGLVATAEAIVDE